MRLKTRITASVRGLVRRNANSPPPSGARGTELQATLHPAGKIMIKDPRHYPHRWIRVFRYERNFEIDRLVVGHGQHRVSTADAGDLLSGCIGGGGDHHGNLELPRAENASRISTPLDGDDRYAAGLEPDSDGGTDSTQATDHHVMPRFTAYAAEDPRKSRADQRIDDHGRYAGREHQPEKLNDERTELEAER
jgi:hypothetical protein